MRHFSVSEKRAGEMAIRKMSEKARKFYNGTDSMSVYEYEDGNTTLYAYSGCLGEASGMTFEELEEEFETLQSEMEIEEEEE